MVSRGPCQRITPAGNGRSFNPSKSRIALPTTVDTPLIKKTSRGEPTAASARKGFRIGGGLDARLCLHDRITPECDHQENEPMRVEGKMY